MESETISQPDSQSISQIASHTSNMTEIYEYVTSVNGQYCKIKKCILSTGSTTTQTLNENGMVHSFDDNPAYILFNLTYTTYEWYTDGRRHREGDKPARINRFSSPPNTIKCSWYINDKLHRDNDQFAEYMSFQTLGQEYFYWYQNGVKHRENDNPAVIARSLSTQQITGRIWFYNGVQHRQLGKPSCITGTEIKYKNDGKYIRYAGLSHFSSITGKLDDDLVVYDSVFYRKNGNIISYCALLNCIKRVKNRMRNRKRINLLRAAPDVDTPMIEELIKYT